MDWAQILIVLLAIVLVLLLAAAVSLVIIFLKLTRQIKLTAKSADKTIHAVEDSFSSFGRTTVPLKITKSMMGHVMKRTRKKDKMPDIGAEE